MFCKIFIKLSKANAILDNLFMMLSGRTAARKTPRDRIGIQEKPLKETFHGYDTHRAVSLVNIETRYDKYLSEACVMECILFGTDELSFFPCNKNRSFIKKSYINIGGYINQAYVDFRSYEAIMDKQVRPFDVNKCPR